MAAGDLFAVVLIFIPFAIVLLSVLIKLYHIRVLTLSFTRLNDETPTMPYYFSWLSLFFSSLYNPYIKFLNSSNEKIFEERMAMMLQHNKHGLYLIYKFINPFNVSKVQPHIVIITSIKVAKQILDQSDVWIKQNYWRKDQRINTSMSLLMSLSCTSMNGDTAKRQRSVLSESLKLKPNFLQCCMQDSIELFTTLFQEILATGHNGENTPNQDLTLKDDHKHSLRCQQQNITIDIIPILSQVTLNFLTHMIFGLTSLQSSAMRPESKSESEVTPQQLTGSMQSVEIDLSFLHQRFVEDFLDVWNHLRVNTTGWTSQQHSQRRTQLEDSACKVRTDIEQLITYRKQLLALQQKNEVAMTSPCVLDNLLKYTIDPRLVINVDDVDNVDSENCITLTSATDQSAVKNNLKIPEKYLTTEELIHNLHNFMLAGFETTVHTLAVSLYHIACSLPTSKSSPPKSHTETVGEFFLSPSTLNVTSGGSSNGIMYFDELDLKSIIKESLRLHPPVLQVARVCNRPSKVFIPSTNSFPPALLSNFHGGNEVIPAPLETSTSPSEQNSCCSNASAGELVRGWIFPENTSVIIDIVALHRDPSIWVTPHCNHRSTNESLPFQPKTSNSNMTLPASSVLNAENKLKKEYSANDFNLSHWTLNSPQSPSIRDLCQTIDNSTCQLCISNNEMKKANWMPFGLGSKSCIGRGIALKITESILTGLTQHFVFSPPNEPVAQPNFPCKTMETDYKICNQLHRAPYLPMSSVASPGISSSQKYKAKTQKFPAITQTPTLRFTEGLYLNVAPR